MIALCLITDFAILGWYSFQFRGSLELPFHCILKAVLRWLFHYFPMRVLQVHQVTKESCLWASAFVHILGRSDSQNSCRSYVHFYRFLESFWFPFLIGQLFRTASCFHITYRNALDKIRIFSLLKDI